MSDKDSSDSFTVINDVTETAVETSKQPHLDSETWDSVFLLLLELLSQGLQCGKISIVDGKLASLLENFFKIWTLSCSKQYPGSSYWKSLQRIFQENSSQYIVLSAWGSIFLALNRRVCFLIKKRDLEENDRNNSAVDTWEHNLTLFCSRQLVHTWYRFLHLPVNPSMLIPVFEKVEHLSSQLSTNNDVQFKFFSALSLKITSTVCSAVYEFMNLPFNSVVRSQLLIAGGVWEVSIPGPNHGYSSSAVAATGVSHNSVIGIARRSHRAPGGSFKTIKETVPRDVQGTIDLNGYPLFITETSQSQQVSVESILNTFGQFLFEVCLAGPGAIYDLVFAQAEALTCLLRLFTWNRNEKRPLNMQYYSTFYCCLYKALNLQFDTYCDVAAYVILSSCNLFLSGTKYCSILVPKYLDRILKYIEDSSGDFGVNSGPNSGGAGDLSTRCHVPIKIFWKSCYHILLSLFPYLVEFHEIHNLSLFTYLERVHNFCFQSVKEEKDASSISLLISLVFSLINATPISVEELDKQLTPRPVATVQRTDTSSSNASTIGSSRQAIFSNSSVDTLVDANFDNSNVVVAIDITGSTSLAVTDGARPTIWDSCNHKLISILINRTVLEWSEDTQRPVVVTALAALRSLALTVQNTDECRTLVVMKLCELIERLLQKPSRHHKTALHSLVVSSYATIAIWLEGNTRSVFKDPKFADAVFEAIEYGLSGSKSISNDSYVYKETKALKVPSQRSRDAAEFLLNSIIDQTCSRRSVSDDLSCINERTSESATPSHFYTVRKERFVKIDEKFDPAFQHENGIETKSEAAAPLSVRIFSPFSSSRYIVVDKQLSAFDKGSIATMIPPAIPMFEIPATASYVPGQIPFLPEPLRYSSNCAPERKLLSLAQEVCCDNTFSSLVDESCEDESVFNFTNKFKSPSMCNEPVPVCVNRTHSRKFVSRFPLLAIDTDDTRNASNVSEPGSKTNITEAPENIESTTNMLEKLSLKISQIVDILYVPPFEHLDKKFSVDELLNMQSTQFAQKRQVTDLVCSLGNGQHQLKQGISEGETGSHVVSESSFCNIFYRCHFLPDETPVPSQMLSHDLEARKQTMDSWQCPSGQNSSQQQQNVHIFLFILNSSAECQQLQDVAWLSTLANKLKCSEGNEAEKRSNTADALNGEGAGDPPSSSNRSSSSGNDNNNFCFAAYSLFIHENSLITVYITNNLKSNVTFQPLVHKCIVQSVNLASMLSSSINNFLFDWSAEHVKPYAKRREVIQKMNVRFRQQILTPQSLWVISTNHVHGSGSENRAAKKSSGDYKAKIDDEDAGSSSSSAESSINSDDNDQ